MSVTPIVYREPEEVEFIQSRAEFDPGLVAEYAEMMQEGIEFDPASGIVDSSGSIYVWDGYHRGQAARAIGKLLAIEANTGTRDEAEWLALGANQKHGLQRSRADKRKAVEAALLHPRGAGLSDREIARHCGVSHPMVGQVRKDLESTGKIYQSEVRTGADGREINTANIGKATLPPSVPPTGGEENRVPPGEICCFCGKELDGSGWPADVEDRFTCEEHRGQTVADYMATKEKEQEALPPAMEESVLCPKCDQAIFPEQDLREDGSIKCDACGRKFSDYSALMAAVGQAEAKQKQDALAEVNRPVELDHLQELPAGVTPMMIRGHWSCGRCNQDYGPGIRYWVRSVLKSVCESCLDEITNGAGEARTGVVLGIELDGEALEYLQYVCRINAKECQNQNRPGLVKLFTQLQEQAERGIEVISTK